MGLTIEQDKLLDKLYLDPKEKSSLRGVKTLYKAAKSKDSSIIIADVKGWLKGQSVYTIYKPARKRYSRNPILAQYCGELFQFDIAHFEVEKFGSKTYRYLFVGIDSYSRLVFGVPLIDHTSKDIIFAMNEILKSGYSTENALCDGAGENTSAKTRLFFEKCGINLYITASLIHTPQAERLIRSLKTFVRRHQAKYNSDHWYDAARLFFHNHNHITTRTHGQIPWDVYHDPKTDWKAFEKMYGNHVSHTKSKVPASGPKKNSTVRVSLIRRPFDKESDGSWSKQLFKVSELDEKNKNPTLKLIDHKNKTIRGRFYLPEVQEVTLPSENPYYEIEEILSKKKKSGVMYYRVKWSGYSKAESTWLKASELRKLGHHMVNKNVL